MDYSYSIALKGGGGKRGRQPAQEEKRKRRTSFIHHEIFTRTGSMHPIAFAFNGRGKKRYSSPAINLAVKIEKKEGGWELYLLLSRSKRKNEKRTSRGHNNRASGEEKESLYH